MAGLNKVMLIGNLGRDPEVRHLEGGATVANFSLATTEHYRDKNNEWHDQTEWHNVVAWRGLAERAEKALKKGTTVYVEGKIQSRSWEDKDGHKKYITEIVAEAIQILSPRANSGEGGNSFSEEGKADGRDLPF